MSNRVEVNTKRKSIKVKVIPKKKSTKGKLLKGILENVPAESFDILHPELTEILEDSSGIYVLYNNEKIHYIGLAKEIKGRLQSHMDRTRHKGKWNKFSVYVVKNVDYLKDLETLLLRIVRPKGNKIRGHVPTEAKLNVKLRRMASRLRKGIQGIEKSI